MCFYRKIFSFFFLSTESVGKRRNTERRGGNSLLFLLLLTPTFYSSFLQNPYWSLVIGFYEKKLVVDGDMVWSGFDLI